jgi:EAL domain-containing protein (putative c-di-GMP-specific phosphodiesterase class I)
LVATKNLGKKIDRWTLLNSAKMLAAHCSAGHEDTCLLINITPPTLRDESFAGWLAIALKTADIPAKSIILQFPNQMPPAISQTQKLFVKQWKK